MLSLLQEVSQPSVKKRKIWTTMRAGVYVIASIIIVLAVLSFITQTQAEDIIAWISINFGATFSMLFGILLVVAGISVAKVWCVSSVEFWSQVGVQTANAISTLALTFTLLGISLGIGALSEQSLHADNVDKVIAILTSQFSMAFMTTVVGLPTATALRASIAIIIARHIETGTILRNVK